jgi:hypothetical protein
MGLFFRTRTLGLRIGVGIVVLVQKLPNVVDVLPSQRQARWRLNMKIRRVQLPIPNAIELELPQYTASLHCGVNAVDIELIRD